MRWLAAAVIMGALASAGAFAVAAGTLRPVAPGAASRVFAVPAGAPLQVIADALTENGFIRSQLAFVAAARVRGVGGRLQQGEYALSPGMPMLEILDRLVQGRVLLHPVTIPEGYTVAQIADLLAARGLTHRDEFLQAVRRPGDFDFAFLEGRRTLEGYLFPDTYHLPRSLTAPQILRRMLTRFDERVTPALRARATALGVSLHDAVTIASMVERETKVGDERPLVAGVIYNRLRRGWRLEIDATVLYALGRHTDRLTTADLQAASPYNTYRHAGLPPGPICNPGLAAIRAALRPAATPYLFYVLRADGRHAFSRTLAEHQQAIRRSRP